MRIELETHSATHAPRRQWDHLAANGGNWVNLECSSTDNNTNWGACVRERAGCRRGSEP